MRWSSSVFVGWMVMQAAMGRQLGIAERERGSDGKPVYAPAGATPVTSGQTAFELG